MAAFCSSHNFCIDCCFPGGLADETGLLAFAGGLVPLLDLVRFIGSALEGLDGLRLRSGKGAKP
jgi:hypothetical protein